MADGEKAAEQIGLDREAQRNSVSALQRDIASVKQREEDREKDRRKDGERARLSDEKAAVSLRREPPGFFFWNIALAWLMYDVVRR